MLPAKFAAKDYTSLPLRELALAAFAVLTLFIWQRNKGFGLSDEGLLWYGVQRVLQGEVPIRDFMAYDPGRYYWSAALMSLWGDHGIMALRGSVAVFQSLGLFVGLVLISRGQEKPVFFYLLLSAFTLMVWMHPRHKLLDVSLSILLVGLLTYLVKAPRKRRYFVTGLCVGLVAVFGRNHAVYGVASSVAVMGWLNIKRLKGPTLFKGFIFWAIGVGAGFAPILLMMLLVPGFAVAFWESIRFLFELKTTNLTLPIPWPWLADFSSPLVGHAIRQLLFGLFLIGTVLFGALSIAWIVWRRYQQKAVPAALVGASFVALPYAHFAFSRADVSHETSHCSENWLTFTHRMDRPSLRHRIGQARIRCLNARLQSGNSIRFFHVLLRSNKPRSNASRRPNPVLPWFWTKP